MGYFAMKCKLYHNILFNLETKEAIFALFIGIGGLCWIVPKENYNKVSLANTYVESSFSIVLNDSTFMNEYRKIYITMDWILEYRMHSFDMAQK